MRHRNHLTIHTFPTLRIPFSIFEGEKTDYLEFFNAYVPIMMFEDEKFVYVRCAVPGADRDDIELTFENGLLWIRTEIKEDEDEEECKIFFATEEEKNYTYRITLPPDVDESAVPDSVCKNGMLKIVFPKVRENRSKIIAITCE